MEKEIKKLIIVSGKPYVNDLDYNELIKLLTDNGCVLKSDGVKEDGRRFWEFERIVKD